MRDIRFRGKRKDNGEWVYGYCCRTFRWMGDTEPVAGIQESEGFFFREVVPETVGEYTGLHDKNGKEIYEGDLLKDDRGMIYKVKWGCDLLWLAITNEKHCNCYCPKGVAKRAEVISNIHDNPELLEVAE
jgi:uncharacterized phage protein (TIGR01671 family)